MALNNDAGFQVIFHARESLRKRGRSDAEIQKILTIMRENLLDSPSNILDISQETWLTLNLPVGLLLELRRAASAAGFKQPGDRGSEAPADSREEPSVNGDFTEESSLPLMDGAMENEAVNFTDSPIQRPDTFHHHYRPSDTQSSQHHWSRGATMHAGRKDTDGQFKSGYNKWSGESFGSRSFHHHQSNHYRGPPHKRVRLRRNDSSPSIGNSKTEIVDCRKWMPPSQGPPPLNDPFQHDTPVLLNRATEAGEAAANLAIQQEENSNEVHPSGPPSAPGYWGKLVCTDMDGTVLGPDHNIHGITFEMIHKARELGCAVIPATGRCRMSAAKCFSKGGIDLYSLPGVYLNGCVVYDEHGQVASNVVLDYQIVCDLVNGLRRQDTVIPLICSGDRVLAPFTNDFVRCMERMFDDPSPEDCGGYDGLLERVRDEAIPVHMVHVITPDPQYMKTQVVDRLKAFAKSNGCAAAQSLSFLCDIIPQTANKGYGIRVLKERLGYNTVACIGDAMNDREMLQNADVPVVMGNAMTEIKSLGRLKVNSNDHALLPGVADLMSRIIAAKQ
ncbi:hypothetical protein FOL47_003869 [Perkinsus chesapeaki]|uniref:Uncharacterized protein n=2 Tax=Alveolata TaxID=33630 RepID=A0A7J6M5X2_PERCH|nr:hypothetical protein FOL47_003869 [Perkinsus chesapeaki]